MRASSAGWKDRARSVSTTQSIAQAVARKASIASSSANTFRNRLRGFQRSNTLPMSKTTTIDFPVGFVSGARLVDGARRGGLLLSLTRTNAIGIHRCALPFEPTRQGPRVRKSPLLEKIDKRAQYIRIFSDQIDGVRRLLEQDIPFRFGQVFCRRQMQLLSPRLLPSWALTQRSGAELEGIRSEIRDR